MSKEETTGGTWQHSWWDQPPIESTSNSAAGTDETGDDNAGTGGRNQRRWLSGLDQHPNESSRNTAASTNGTSDSNACPSHISTFGSDVLCKICGDDWHPTIYCPVKNPAYKKTEEEYHRFGQELGEMPLESLTDSSSVTLALPGSSGTNPPLAGATDTSSATTQADLWATLIKPNEYDATKLYVCYLHPTIWDDDLMNMFSPYGEILMAKVIKDRDSGSSKGYGFVKYANIQQARNAIAALNGSKQLGKTIAVRVAHQRFLSTVPPGPPAPPMPTYTAPNEPVRAYGYSVTSMPPYVQVPHPRPMPRYLAPNQPVGAYGYSVTSMPPNAGIPYPRLPSSYAPYYPPPAWIPYPRTPHTYAPQYPPPAVPQSTLDPSRLLSNVPWASYPPVRSPSSSAERSNYSTDENMTRFFDD